MSDILLINDLRENFESKDQQLKQYFSLLNSDGWVAYYLSQKHCHSDSVSEVYKPLTKVLFMFPRCVSSSNEIFEFMVTSFEGVLDIVLGLKSDLVSCSFKYFSVLNMCSQQLCVHT